jgi:hypothetical protein
MNTPRVSVLIATYNWSAVLPFSIGSVLAQTFGDFELLVIGDGCTDDSAAVVAAIDDPRVRWINLPQNTGHQSAPNNRGLQEARGELIAYLGHDDTTGRCTRGIPGRVLFPLSLRELARRTWLRTSTALLRPRKGAIIDQMKKYKGVET